MSNEVNHVGKAPMFNGTNYSTWKIKMSTHLKAMSFHIWSIVDVGFAITGTPLTEIDHCNLQLNAQAMNALFNSFSQEEFDRVSNLETAYEIWNKLAEIHEGTSEYKDAKLHFLKIQYETFSMLPHESVNDMYGRLNVIVNDLKGLGATYTDLEVAQKMLRALPKKYETLVTMLINSDMSRMTPASLLGKINTNDMYKLKKKEMEEASPSKKCIALQAEVEDKGKSKVNEANDDLKEEIALLARRFNDLLGRRKERVRGSNSNRRRNRRPNKTLSNLRCFECGEKGHFASKCPSKDDDGDKSSKKKSGGYKLMKKLKKEGKKIEAFIGEWDSNEESSASSGSEEEGGDDASSKKKKMAVVVIKEAPTLFAPLCLMAKGSSKVTSLSDSESDDDCDDVSYDELVSMFEELHAYSEKEIVKFKALKMDHASLEVLYEELKTSHERLTISHKKLNSSSSSCVSICDASLVVENNELKEQVAKLNKSLERCFNGKNTLDKILSEQRCILNKEGLGFIPKKSKKPSHRATRFVKSNGKHCSKYCEVGHLVNYRTGGSHWVLDTGCHAQKFTSCDNGCTQHTTGDRAMFTTFEVGGKEQEKVTFGDNSKGKVIGLVAKTSLGWLWHRRLAHVGMNQLSKLSKRDLVVGLKDVKFEKDKLCSACQAGKQVACSHPTKSIMSTPRPMELLHIDLFGPTTYKSIGGNSHCLVIIDDYSRYTWVFFLHDKSIVAELFKKFANRAQNEFSCTLVKIRSDNGSEFKNTNIEDYCDDLGIKHELSATYSPQQNGVVERKNRTLIEMARTMLDEYGYASNSKAYRVYNKNKGIVEETADVQFNETNGSQEGHENLDDVGDEGLMRAMKNMSIGDVKPIEVEDKPSTSTQDEPSTSASPSQPQVEVEEEKAQDSPMPPRIHTVLSKHHPIDQFLGDISKGVQTRSRVASICEHYSFVSCLEPKHVDEALCDPDWMNAMHEELNNFARNKVWTLVERPRDHNVIGTKWVFRNKQDEIGLVVRNKPRLVAQGFTQDEGLDFGETFAPVARLEAIRILLAFASCFDIKLFQMDVKSAFLNGEIAELVFVEQPLGFEDPKNPNHVYKLSKALYGLKQAPRAWYERLRDFLLSKYFKIGKVDTTLFTKIIGDDFFVCQIYVDDIIFGSTNEVFCKEFGNMMSREFEMSMIGELSFFLGVQIKQLKDGTFVSQTKYIKDLLKRFGLEDAKSIKTPIATNGHLDLDEGGKPVDLKLYRSMIGSLLFLTASRPDIIFSVCMCARFQAAPKECHLVAVKRILRYLKHSSTIGLWYPKGEARGVLRFAPIEGSFLLCLPALVMVVVSPRRSQVRMRNQADRSMLKVVRMKLRKMLRGMRWKNAQQYTILRHHDQFRRPNDCNDSRFHTRYQKAVYEQVYANKAFTEHKWISWRHIGETPEFVDLQGLFKAVGIDRIITMKQPFDEDLIWQFYATFYEEGGRHTYGKVAGLRVIPSVINRIVKATILPRCGNNDDIRGVAWHVIDAIMDGRRFHFINLMMKEIAISKGTIGQGIYYAPYIMRLIQSKLGQVGNNLKEHKEYKPRLQLSTPRAPRVRQPTFDQGASSSATPPPPHGYDTNAFFHPQYAYFGM
uniref:Retrotransposon protein, putative, Ty1-copia subclass n=1 Tax=Oryza sativa subsp. japonica TaxID=39947 RepID=Q33BC8_ORYSJ|nr:retrotransposon protein, putative, Ty1-copia subclass [Oryza sativa Japonica Group]